MADKQNFEKLNLAVTFFVCLLFIYTSVFTFDAWRLVESHHDFILLLLRYGCQVSNIITIKRNTTDWTHSNLGEKMNKTVTLKSMITIHTN